MERRPPDHICVDVFFVEDPRVSMKAKGIALWLLAQDPEERWSNQSIADEIGMGRDAVKAGIAELKKTGYLEAERVRTTSGKIAGFSFRMNYGIRVVQDER
jgi:biotin operon repressor